MSIKNWIFKNKLKDKIKTYSEHTSSQKLRDEFPGHEVFSVVRNTYTRMVSLYLYEMKSLTSNRFNKIYNLSSVREMRLNSMLREKNTFTFEEWWERITAVELDVFRQSQLWYCEGVDHILSYENLDKDFKIIQERVECFAPLPVRNVSSYKETAATLLKDEVVLSIIEDSLEEEIKHFGFKRPYDL